MDKDLVGKVLNVSVTINETKWHKYFIHLCFSSLKHFQKIHIIGQFKANPLGVTTVRITVLL